MSKLYRMTWMPPLGRHFPVDEGALQAFETAMDAQQRQDFVRAMHQPPHELPPPRWDKIAIWGGIFAFCLAAWAGIIWGAREAADWLAPLIEGMVR